LIFISNKNIDSGSENSLLAEYAEADKMILSYDKSIYMRYFRALVTERNKAEATARIGAYWRSRLNLVDGSGLFEFPPLALNSGQKISICHAWEGWLRELRQSKSEELSARQYHDYIKDWLMPCLDSIPFCESEAEAVKDAHWKPTKESFR
jgi:hypothetical protein